MFVWQQFFFRSIFLKKIFFCENKLPKTIYFVSYLGNKPLEITRYRSIFYSLFTTFHCCGACWIVS